MLEVIAMISMLIDHIGAYLLPEYKILRIIGRLAMPIYTWQVIKACEHTRNKKKYLIRLIIIAVVSQIPYMLLGNKILNIVFLFAAYVGLSGMKNRILRSTLLCVGAGFLIEYNVYGAALILIYESKKAEIVKHTLINLMMVPLGWINQLYSIIATMLIKEYKCKPLKRPGRYIYQVFYPLHLSIIFIAKLFL
jgi:hypothetical protein